MVVVKMLGEVICACVDGQIDQAEPSVGMDGLIYKLFFLWIAVKLPSQMLLFPPRGTAYKIKDSYEKAFTVFRYSGPLFLLVWRLLPGRFSFDGTSQT